MSELLADIFMVIICVFAIGMWSVLLWAIYKDRKRKNIGWKSTYTYRIWNNYPLKRLPITEVDNIEKKEHPLSFHNILE